MIVTATEETSEEDFSWKEVGKSDVSGAVGGAGGVGAIPEAGVGAFSGSVAGSVGAAVEQIIDILWLEK